MWSLKATSSVKRVSPTLPGVCAAEACGCATGNTDDGGASAGTEDGSVDCDGGAWTGWGFTMAGCGFTWVGCGFTLTGCGFAWAGFGRAWPG